MTFYRKPGFPGWYLRLTRNGRVRRIGLETTSRATAKLMANWLDQMRRDRRWDVIDGIVERRFTLPDAYDHRGSLDAWLAERTEVDLSPLVDEWNGLGKKARSATYVRQVREFVPKGERFPLSKFRRREIAKFLEGLDVADPTRNRYKAALSQFARWLIRHELLEANPVRESGTFSEHKPRMVYLSPADARRLVDALSGETRIVAALMAGTGMEWQAVAAATRADVDRWSRTIRAHGSKTAARERTVAVTEDWAWEIIEPHLWTLAPLAPLVTVKERAALREQTEACERLKLPRNRLHDWRHTYAVTAIRRGDDHQAIKNQLGHAPNSALLYKVYGAFIAEVNTKKRTNAAMQLEASNAN